MSRWTYHVPGDRWRARVSEGVTIPVLSAPHLLISATTGLPMTMAVSPAVSAASVELYRFAHEHPSYGCVTVIVPEPEIVSSSGFLIQRIPTATWSGGLVPDVTLGLTAYFFEPLLDGFRDGWALARSDVPPPAAIFGGGSDRMYSNGEYAYRAAFGAGRLIAEPVANRRSLIRELCAPTFPYPNWPSSSKRRPWQAF